MSHGQGHEKPEVTKQMEREKIQEPPKQLQNEEDEQETTEIEEEKSKESCQ